MADKSKSAQEIDGVVLKDTLNSHWKNNKSNFGFKMLLKMGWNEDQGLGKHDQGEVGHVKVKRREEGLGLGVEKSSDGAGNRGWLQGAQSFNDVLSSLQGVYGNGSDDEKSKKKKKDKKKDKKKEKKEKTVEEIEKKRKLEVLLGVGIKYGKLRASKDLSTKSAEDLKAIFGSTSTSSAFTSSDSSDKEKSSKKQRK